MLSWPERVFRYAAGVVASEFVKTWLEARGGNVLLRTCKRTGKYGRWLAEVYLSTTF